MTNISRYEAIDTIQQFIDKEHELRNKVCRHPIQRIYSEKKDEFKPHRFLWDEINYVQKDDLEFWQQTLLDWNSKEFPLLETIRYNQ